MAEIADSILREIAAKIAGDIVLSPNPGKAMKRWRETFRISQIEIAQKMKVSSSVISDYESGRRKSPGARFIKKFVNSLIEVDLERGREVLPSLLRIILGGSKLYEAVIDMREFLKPIPIGDFCNRIKAELVVSAGAESTLIFGYTVVDSIKLVLEVPSYEYIRLYGATTQRAAIFTRVTFGRSPMVAIKAMQAGMGGLRPALVVMHGPTRTDRLAEIIAKKEGIPLAISRASSVEELLELLKKIN